MAKQSWVNADGTWRKVKSAWINIDGIWEKNVMPKGVVNGNYKEFMSYFLQAVITSFKHQGIRKTSLDGGLITQLASNDSETNQPFIESISYHPIRKSFFVVYSHINSPAYKLKEFSDDLELIKESGSSLTRYNHFNLGRAEYAYYVYKTSSTFDLRCQSIHGDTIFNVPISIGTSSIHPIKLDVNGDVYATMYSYQLRKYTNSGGLAWSTDIGEPQSIDLDENYIYISTGFGVSRIRKTTGISSNLISFSNTNKPSKVIIHKDSVIVMYVDDLYYNVIRIYNKSGTLIKNIKLPITGRFPISIKCDAQGDLYARDDAYVVKLNREGEEIWRYAFPHQTYMSGALEVAPGAFSTFPEFYK